MANKVNEMINNSAKGYWGGLPKGGGKRIQRNRLSV